MATPLPVYKADPIDPVLVEKPVTVAPSINPNSSLSLKVIVSTLPPFRTRAISLGDKKGAVLSVTMTSGVEAVLVFPARSSEVALILCVASGDKSIFKDQIPLLTVVDPVIGPSTSLSSVMIVPFSPLPVMVSPIVVCVMLSLSRIPVSSLSSKLSAVGATGSTRSTVKLNVADVGLVLPAASVALAVIL